MNNDTNRPRFHSNFHPNDYLQAIRNLEQQSEMERFKNDLEYWAFNFYDGKPYFTVLEI